MVMPYPDVRCSHAMECAASDINKIMEVHFTAAVASQHLDKRVRILARKPQGMGRCFNSLVLVITLKNFEGNKAVLVRARLVEKVDDLPDKILPPIQQFTSKEIPAPASA